MLTKEMPEISVVAVTSLCDRSKTRVRDDSRYSEEFVVIVFCLWLW